MVEQFIQFLENIPELKSEFQNLLEIIKLQNQQDSNYENPLYCQACKIAIGKLYSWDKVEIKFSNFMKLTVAYACSEQYQWFPLDVCLGIADQQIPSIIESFWEHYFNPKFLCPLLTLCNRKLQVVDIDALIQDIMKNKPQKQQLIPKLENVGKMVHITDIHLDQAYEENTISKCEDPVCCRKNSQPRNVENQEDLSGYWGTVAWCDIPQRTFQQGVNFIKDQLPDIDFTIWTGDNTSFNVFEQNQEQNLENTLQITNILKDTLPDKKVYPIFGNFEIYPINLYNFDESSQEEINLKEKLSTMWEDWIGEDGSKMLKEKGFYEIVIKEYNLKIIALNTQASDTQNFTLIQDPSDPDNMLELLRQSLQESEDNNNQPVWIFSHIPVGRGSRSIWSKVYNALIDRYSYIIRGQFNGHTHADEIGLFYDQDGNVNNVRFVAPSFTTYFNRKPSFRVFEFDTETLQITNYYQYRLDLDYWNQFTDPNTQLQWELAYDFVSEYKMENMYDLNNFKKFRQNIENDLDMYSKYVYNFNSGVGEQQQTSINNKYQCQMLPLKQLQDQCLGKEYKPYILDWIAGPWLEKKKK